MPALLISLNQCKVGILSEGSNGRVSFRFLEAYRAMENRPVLGQAFEDDLDQTYSGRSPGQLPAFFGNLLPEGSVRSIIERSLKLDYCSDLKLLEVAAKDLPGALIIDPTDDYPAQAELAVASADDLGESSVAAGLHFSLAGVQLKFSAMLDNDRLSIPGKDGAGEWIVKVAVKGYDDLPANEFFIMNWARQAGFEVPEVKLIGYEQLGPIQAYISAGADALAVKRFDRSQKGRVHQEDFNQVLGRFPASDHREKYAFTYDELGILIQAVAGEGAAEEYIRRLIFMVAIGNNDAHLKNWALLYRNGINAELSPLYDQVSTIAWNDMDREWALKLAGARDFGRADTRAIIKLAARMRIAPKLARSLIDETLSRISEAWGEMDKILLPDSHRLAIVSHWERIPFLREWGQLGS